MNCASCGDEGRLPYHYHQEELSFCSTCGHDECDTLDVMEELLEATRTDLADAKLEITRLKAEANYWRQMYLKGPIYFDSKMGSLRDI